MRRGKAWPKGDPEPAAWQIDKTDPIGNRQGAPGFFIDAEFGAYIDNLKIDSERIDQGLGHEKTCVWTLS